jgi:hypothetical protein
MTKNYLREMMAFTLMVLLGISAPGLSVAQAAFKDDFESADLSHSENGFRWLGPNRTSIVRDDQRVVWAAGSTRNEGPYSGKQWENGPGKAGRHALRFDYPAGASMAEQRFVLGAPARDLWVRYWLRVPINFKHGTGNTNNKLFAIWMDEYEYEGNGPTVVWQFRNDGGGGSNTVVYAIRSEPWTLTSNRHTGEKQSQQFIRYPIDQGRWMELVFHVQAASRTDKPDGVIEMWRRWEGEQTFTLMHEITDAVIQPPQGGPSGWRAGYIMGWANATYEADTEFLVDNFEVSLNRFGDLPPRPKKPNDVAVR